MIFAAAKAASARPTHAPAKEKVLRLRLIASVHRVSKLPKKRR